MNSGVTSVEEKKWQAEQDARTLAEAKIIVNDSSRWSAAKAAAKEIADKQQKEASAMRQVAGSNSAPKEEKKSSISPQEVKVKVKAPKQKSSNTNFNVFQKL